MRFIITGLLFCIPVLAIAQEPEDPVFVLPQPEWAKDIKLLQTGNVYEIVAEGNSPVISFAPLAADLPSGFSRLSFDYFSTVFLDDGELILESGGKQVASVFLELSIMEGWSVFTIDLSGERKVWGKRGDVMRFRIGKRAGYRMQVRNIRFREMNAFEQHQAINKEHNRIRDEQELLELAQYFNATFPDSITDVTVTDKQVKISGFIKSSGNFYLAELPLYARAHMAFDTKRLFKISRKGKFSLRTKRQVTEGKHTRDALFSKWVIMEKSNGKMRMRSHAHYPDSIVAKYDLPDEQPANMKGLGDFNAKDAEMIKDIDSLGVSAVTVNIWLRGLFNSNATDTSMPFIYNGKTYHANLSWVKAMDRTMMEAAKRKLIVSAIILVDQAFQFSDTGIGKLMAHPDCDPAGVYCMPNTFSAAGMAYYGAALDFLASRYSRPDKQFGRIHYWIAQNEVDAGWTWTNMGEKDPDLYMNAYHTSMRLIYLTARKYNAHAKTLISLTHNWNWAPVKRFYRPKQLLEILLHYSALEGDFDWGIGYHPFPQSLFEPRAWLDERTDFSFDTQMITFRNVEVINAWVNQPHTFYKGKYLRLLYLSEQGPNSRDYTREALLDQAASMAYVWKKIKGLNAVKSFHYQSWRDYRFDGGLRLGLRRYPDDEEHPLGRKPVWYVFRCMGTDEEDKCFEFAKPLVGISCWAEVVYRKPIR
ncbi:DUF5722 domain-containing protein [Agriterribacter sp.]|uniref:DUF5722 domain-containing protein n=1 Tax=Agriterribacter sp. TaxID=2821509 RepID=UPI002D1130BB|nr:DUF5722 domain-containing protein [Agriterribacter sp.]HRP54664.1 DUF5722 domain-containing protein [Agriterribacter sp.]